MSRRVNFSWREIEVLYKFMSDGAGNETIARRLGLDIETIKTYMRRIYAKAEVANRTALMLVLIRKEVLARDPHGNIHEF